MSYSSCWVIVKKEPKMCEQIVKVYVNRPRAKAFVKMLEEQLDKDSKILYNIEEIALDDITPCTCDRCLGYPDLRDKEDREFQEEGDR